MMTQVTLLLICMLFPQAWSLNCYECVLGITNCQEKSCPDKCLTATTSVYVDNTKISDVNIQSCSTADSCISGSMNLGKMKVTNNGKCCSTPLCNTEKLPALQRQSVNGRMCYTCDDKGCYGTVNCEGDEDRCISLTVQQGSNALSMKGCVSKSFCVASGSASTPGLGVSNIQCCDGNLCNGAESYKLSFLLMLVPLLSSILF
ncbi:urokinase plasminogen activator surface receptor-like [Silurus meridionalis]|uniref:UPAR/Ly6 domain-containing protein n=1 Tax=Silurus meridionalis TaxID=175797 RepID=A0A8T0AT55_SILME|nr:urokinase plasminogen activator surface receptor-like [Silurus meridionalis]KAF7696310.1 hypothetical protein HF521_006404 [Silurus meridionalis]